MYLWLIGSDCAITQNLINKMVKETAKGDIFTIFKPKVIKLMLQSRWNNHYKWLSHLRHQ